MKIDMHIPPVTAEEYDVWVTALRMGVGSQANVARILGVTQQTLIRRHQREGDHEWWWRDVFHACIAAVEEMHRAEMIAARQGSRRYMNARRHLRSMRRHLDNLPPSAFDAVKPPLMLTPAQAEARAFLHEVLSGQGRVNVQVIRAKATARGIAPITLARVSARMGVIKRQKGFGADKKTTWELPPDDD